MEELTQIIRQILETEPRKIVVSNRRQKEYPYVRTVLERICLKKKPCFQMTRYTEKQAFHENLSLEEGEKALRDIFLEGYKQADSFGETFACCLKESKKGKLFFSKKKTDAALARKITGQSERGHNKKKRYLLEEGRMIPPLVDLGIFTPSGKVVNAYYDKYRQINRFLEIVDDVIPEDQKEFTIIDFGCGKSYLTFVLYYYFVFLKRCRVTMIGLDLKKEVVEHCNSVAKKYGYEGLSFEIGDINGYQYSGRVDMVVTLHACDTATDYALYHAVRWGTRMIFSVPCCQHELNGQMKSDKFSILTRYGIIQERTAALMTDAVRGNLLEACGYKTQLMEFVDFSHTPKNILIRAVKGNVGKEKKKRVLREIRSLTEEFGFSPTLLRLLEQDGILSSEEKEGRESLECS